MFALRGIDNNAIHGMIGGAITKRTSFVVMVRPSHDLHQSWLGRFICKIDFWASAWAVSMQKGADVFDRPGWWEATLINHSGNFFKSSSNVIKASQVRHE